MTTTKCNYWALDVGYHNVAIVNVTSEDTHYYYGKFRDGGRTHGAKRGIVGRFEDRSKVETAVAAYKAARDSFNDELDANAKALSDIRARQKKAIDDAMAAIDNTK